MLGHRQGEATRERIFLCGQDSERTQLHSAGSQMLSLTTYPLRYAPLLHCSASFPEAFQKKKVSFFLLLREWKEIISSYLEILKAYGRAHTLVCSQCSVDKSRFGLGSRMTQARFRGFTFALPQPALTCRPNLYFSCCNSAFSSFSPPLLPALVPIHTSRIFVHFLCTYP